MITCAREPAARPNGAGLGAKADAVAQAAIQSMIRIFNVEQSQWWWPRKDRGDTVNFFVRQRGRQEDRRRVVFPSMEEAEARRQKLQALKERAKRARDGGADAEDAPKLKFRNYQVPLCAHVPSASSRVCRRAYVCSACHLASSAHVPGGMQRTHSQYGGCFRGQPQLVDVAVSDLLTCANWPQPKADELQDGVVAPVKISVDKELESMGAGQTATGVQLDVAPKKANWDLKQHIAKKLEKLERRTQQAIVELIKEKVAQEGDAEESGRLLAAGVASKT